MCNQWLKIQLVSWSKQSRQNLHYMHLSISSDHNLSAKQIFEVHSFKRIDFAVFD